MLISITNVGEPATYLGFLLHKNPSNLHSAGLTFGKAFVFYSAATPERCTACMLLEIDPVELVRGAQKLEDYVNDRPYVSSSYLAVAIARVFGTALAGNCQKRPELVDTKLPLEVAVEVIRSRGGEVALRRLFEPLGYRVDATQLPLDEKLPEWGESRYFRLTLTANATVHDALSHLYVLLPVLDEEKHYFVGDAEVEKLLRHGEGWLSRQRRERSTTISSRRSASHLHGSTMCFGIPLVESLAAISTTPAGGGRKNSKTGAEDRFVPRRPMLCSAHSCCPHCLRSSIDAGQVARDGRRGFMLGAGFLALRVQVYVDVAEESGTQVHA